MGTARTKANNKWNAKAYDRVNLVLKKETSPTKDEVQAAADAKGESLNAYIVEAIRQRLESDMPTGRKPHDGIDNREPAHTIQQRANLPDGPFTGPAI